MANAVRRKSREKNKSIKGLQHGLKVGSVVFKEESDRLIVIHHWPVIGGVMNK